VVSCRIIETQSKISNGTDFSTAGTIMSNSAFLCYFSYFILFYLFILYKFGLPDKPEHLLKGKQNQIAETQKPTRRSFTCVI
jgi:hypothetical protein